MPMTLKTGLCPIERCGKFGLGMTMRNVPVGGTGVWPVAVAHVLIG